MTAKRKRPQMREEIKDLKAENAQLLRKIEALEEALWFERTQQQRKAQQRACINGSGYYQ